MRLLLISATACSASPPHKHRVRAPFRPSSRLRISRRLATRNKNVLLTDVLVDELRKRRFTYKGKEYPLSTNAIDQIVRELSSPSLNEGLLAANERLYNKLCLGVTVKEFVDGGTYSPTIPIIDWNDSANNAFTVTEELEVLATGGTHTRRPDANALLCDLTTDLAHIYVAVMLVYHRHAGSHLRGQKLKVHVFANDLKGRVSVP